MADAKLSEKELAALNAAAVTREYNVHPRLGEFPFVHLAIDKVEANNVFRL